MKIQKLNNINENKFITLYGEPKTGKTTFALNDTKYKTLYIQCYNDSGMSGISDKHNKIDVVTVDEASTVPITKQVFDIINKITAQKLNYDVIVLDPFNFIQQDSERRVNGGKALEIQHWGQVIRMMNNLLNKLNSLKHVSNVVVICHTRYKDIISEKIVKKTRILTDLNMNVHTFLLSISSDVVFTYKEKQHVIFDLGENSSGCGGSRNSKLPKKSDNLTLEMLIEE